MIISSFKTVGALQSLLTIADSSVDVSQTTQSLRDRVAGDCMSDILEFLSKSGGNGQIVIYDAVNASVSVRHKLHRQFSHAGIQTIFVESVCTDESIIQANVRNVKVSSPDYEGWDPDKAVQDYLRRIDAKIPHYEEMSRDKESDVSWVKMINIGERMVVNKGATGEASTSGHSGNFGYLGLCFDAHARIFSNNDRISNRVFPHESACKASDAVLCACRQIRR